MHLVTIFRISQTCSSAFHQNGQIRDNPGCECECEGTRRRWSLSDISRLRRGWSVFTRGSNSNNGGIRCHSTSIQGASLFMFLSSWKLLYISFHCSANVPPNNSSPKLLYHGCVRPHTTVPVFAISFHLPLKIMS